MKGGTELSQASTGLIQEHRVVLLVTSINSKIYLHMDFLVLRPEAWRRRVSFRVPVRALLAQHAFDDAAQQAWVTVLSRHSQRWINRVLDPRPDADGVDKWMTDPPIMFYPVGHFSSSVQ